MKKQNTALANAIVSSLMNTSLTGVYPLAGLVADQYNFLGLSLFLAGISALSVFVSLLWNYVDRGQKTPILNNKEANKMVD